MNKRIPGYTVSAEHVDAKRNLNRAPVRITRADFPTDSDKPNRAPVYWADADSFGCGRDCESPELAILDLMRAWGYHSIDIHAPAPARTASVARLIVRDIQNAEAAGIELSAAAFDNISRLSIMSAVCDQYCAAHPGEDIAESDDAAANALDSASHMTDSARDYLRRADDIATNWRRVDAPGGLHGFFPRPAYQCGAYLIARNLAPFGRFALYDLRTIDSHGSAEVVAVNESIAALMVWTFENRF